MRTQQVGKSKSPDEIVEQPSIYCQDPCANCTKAILGHYHADSARFKAEKKEFWPKYNLRKWVDE